MINIAERKITEIMWLMKIAPKKFLCKFPLKLGATIAGAIMCCIMVFCGIGIIAELVNFSTCENCNSKMLKQAYAFSINALIYCMVMVFINMWFVWGVRKEKSSVVLCWVVITFMWWLQTFCFVTVLIFLYGKQATLLAFILEIIFGIFGFALLLYAILVGFGYWLELKRDQTPDGQLAHS